MTFGERLTQLRKEHGYNTRNEFAEKLGIPGTTLRNYETDSREPGHTFLKLISEFFNISVDYLLCLTDEKEVLHSQRLKESEQKHINMYRQLDKHGTEIVDFVLEKEYERCQVIDINQIKEDEAEYNVIPLPIHEDRASAGFGDEFLAESCRIINVIGNRSTIRADFALQVDGRSMEPLYYDGDIVLVHQQPAVDFGEIGIYSVDNKAFIKKQGEDRLISVNEDYDDIEPTEYQECKCFGKVVGKLENDWIVER